MGKRSGWRTLNLANLMTPSSMESEFLACAATIQKAVWLKRFLKRLGINVMDIHCDSEVTIAYAVDPKYHNKLNILISNVIL